jgi:hypothetical protein
MFTSKHCVSRVYCYRKPVGVDRIKMQILILC